MRYLKTHGIILRIRHGKNKDRIVTLFTADKGKIVAVARGSRDMKSKNCAVMNEHNHVSCQLYIGRGMPIVTQTKLLKSYLKTRCIHSLSHLSYIAETVDILMEEEHFIDGVFPLIQSACEIVDQKNYTIILPFFTLKFLTLLGYIQELNLCSNCHSPLRESDSCSLDADCRVVCAACGGSTSAHIPMDCMKILYFAQRNSLDNLLRIDIPKKLHPFFTEVARKFFTSITFRQRKSENFLMRKPE